MIETHVANFEKKNEKKKIGQNIVLATYFSLQLIFYCK